MKRQKKIQNYLGGWFFLSNLSLVLPSNGFFLLHLISLARSTMTVVCVVNCKSLQVATYRHVSTLKRIWTMKNDSKAVHGERRCG
jgi:hypothetical protein